MNHDESELFPQGLDSCMQGVGGAGRGLFPLPFSIPDSQTGRASRRQAQRRSLRHRIDFELSETLQALNWMQGYGFCQQSLVRSPNLLQAEVIERVQGLVERAGDLGELQHPFSPEAALKSLLHGRSDYHEPTSPIALAPFDLELISLPATLKDAPRAEDLLPGKTFFT